VKRGGARLVGFCLALGCLSFLPAAVSPPAAPGWLGVSIADVPEDLAERLAERFGPAAGTGVQIVEVLRAGPAEQGGLRRGDVIVRLDAQPIWEVRQLQRAIRGQPVGRTVALTLLRDAEQVVVALTVGAMPLEAQARLAGERFGLIVREAPRRAEGPGSAAAAGGLVVAFVEADSPAARAGLHPRDQLLEVNRQPVGTLESFARALQAAAGRLSLRVARAGSDAPLSFSIELPTDR
jgi:S1-C subfamily serine protease